MAWEYQTTRLATSTVTERTWDVSSTMAASSSATTAGTILSQTRVSTSWVTAQSTGSTAFFGTGGALGSVTVGTSTITFWESWQIETYISGETYSESSSFMETVGTTRTVLTGTGGTKRESSYRTILSIVRETRAFSDNYFRGGSSFVASTRETLVSSTHISFENAAGSVVTTTFSNSGRTTGSTTGTYTNNRTWWYSNTTVSTSVTTTNTVTTTANLTYSFPTSTTGPGTTSTTSTYLVTTSTTLATTKSIISYSSSSFTVYRILDTVVHLSTSDWGWKSTTGGTGQVSDVAESFTSDSTFLMRAVGFVSTWTPVTVTYTASTGNAGASSQTTSWQDIFVTTESTSSNFSIRTTSLQTYTIGASTTASNMAPLTTQITISRTVTTTTLSSFTWHNTMTTGFGISSNEPIWKSQVLFTMPHTRTLRTTRTGFDVPTYTTTTQGGTLYDSNEPDLYSYSDTVTQSFTNATISTGQTLNKQIGITRNNAEDRAEDQNFQGGNWSYDYGQWVWSSVSASPPSYCTPAIAGGFQAWGNEGGGNPIFKNLAGDVPILSFGHIFPNVIVPLMDQNSRAFSVGTTAMTSRYDRAANNVLLTIQTSTAVTDTVGSTVTISATGTIDMAPQSVHTSNSTVGGFGWDSTQTSQLSASQGIHRYTLLDSTGGSTTGFKSWSPTASTFDVPHGVAIAFETVPKASVFREQYLTNHSPVSIFSAFPSA